MTDESEVTSEEKEELTEGGFVKMDIDMADDTLVLLYDTWAKSTLHPASLEQYNEMKATHRIEEAVASAVMNDAVIDALQAQIALNELRDDSGE